MKRLLAVIAIILLVFGGYSYLNYYKKQKFIEKTTKKCMERGNDMQAFMAAVKSGNAEECETLSSMKARCKAFILNNDSYCKKDDKECKAIASKNESSCISPICKAMASGNMTNCEEADDSEWCRKVASFDPSAFAPRKEECRQLAKDLADQQA